MVACCNACVSAYNLISVYTRFFIHQNKEASRYPHIIAFKKAQAEFLYLSGNTGAAFEAYMEELELNPYDTETRKTLIDRLMESGQSTAAYEQALILWNQGYKDKDTVTYLYSVRPDIWQNVYTLLNPKPQTPDPAPGQEQEEKEEKSE